MITITGTTLDDCRGQLRLNEPRYPIKILILRDRSYSPSINRGKVVGYKLIDDWAPYINEFMFKDLEELIAEVKRRLEVVTRELNAMAEKED